MMMIFKKMTNDDLQVDLRHQDAAESQMRSNVRLKSESQSRVSDNHQSILNLNTSMKPSEHLKLSALPKKRENLAFQAPDIVEMGIDLSEFYKSVEWDILGVPAARFFVGVDDDDDVIQDDEIGDDNDGGDDDDDDVIHDDEVGD